MGKFYHYTSHEDLNRINRDKLITPSSKTLFSSALKGVYFISENPEAYNSSRQPGGLECYVEVEIPGKDTLLKPCAPSDGMQVFLYMQPVELEQFQWAGGRNIDWRPSSGRNWKLALGVVVGVGATAALGKLAYDAYKRREKDKESPTEGLDGFENVCKAAVRKWKSLDYVEGERSGPGTASAAITHEGSDSASEEEFVDLPTGRSGKVKNKVKPALAEDFEIIPDIFSSSGTGISQIHQLEDLYSRKVMVDENEKKRYRNLFNFLLKHNNEGVLTKMKASSPAFNKLYSNTYYGGSFFDGLKVNSSYPEFDLNIMFKWKESDLVVTRLGEDPKKKNFCFLRVKKDNINQTEEKIVDTDHYSSEPVHYLSPVKMFNLLKSSVDRVLHSTGNTINYQGRIYRVTRHEFAPVTLKVVSLEDMDPVMFEVDLVPSLRLRLGALNNYPDLQDRVTSLCDQYGVSRENRNCMAISLHRADKHKFELDFHDVERRILYNRGCVKKVIKLVKFLRDSKGGSVSKLWSHLLKTSVMHHVLITKEQYWNNANLEQCFVDTLRHLLAGLQKDSITDIFFPEVNMLERIKQPHVKREVKSWLEKVIRKYDKTGRVMDIFSC